MQQSLLRSPDASSNEQSAGNLTEDNVNHSVNRLNVYKSTTENEHRRSWNSSASSSPLNPSTPKAPFFTVPRTPRAGSSISSAGVRSLGTSYENQTTLCSPGTTVVAGSSTSLPLETTGGEPPEESIGNQSPSDVERQSIDKRKESLNENEDL